MLSLSTLSIILSALIHPIIFLKHLIQLLVISKLLESFSRCPDNLPQWFLGDTKQSGEGTKTGWHHIA